MMNMTSKNKIVKAAKHISIPTHDKANKAHTLFNLQIGKVILQVKKTV